jgi:aminoglycoside 6'-N-acetyltransferase
MTEAEPSLEGYAFRPAMRADLPLLRRWLQTPEVQHWWGDPADETALLEADLDDPRMVMRIVSLGGQPFAYAQDYRIDAWPQPHFAALPPGARAMDTFIGESSMLGRGHGSTFLRLLATRLVAEGAPLVAIDPNADNLRARRAYAKAGFREENVVETADGPVVLMVFTDSADPGRTTTVASRPSW